MLTEEQKDRLWVRSMDFCGKYCGCHQMPTRSFFLGGRQLPLCARCTGIVLGHLTGLVVSLFFDFPFVILLLMIPMALDGGIQYKTRYESTNFRRVVTGFLFGFSFMSTLVHIIRLLNTAL